MKRMLGFLFALFLAAAAPSFAADVTVDNPHGVRLGTVYTLHDGVTVNGTATVNSNALFLTRMAFFGAWYQCTSASGTPDVDLVWQESPTKEETDFVDADTFAAAVTNENKNLAAIHPPPMLYGRVRIVGNAGNPADTVCTVKVFIQTGAKVD